MILMMKCQNEDSRKVKGFTHTNTYTENILVLKENLLNSVGQ